MTKLSAVMSVYNGAAHLAETLDSILAQTESDFELIAVDDGSTDGSGAMLDAFAARDRRVRVIHQENRGLTKALIAGCAAARAPFIARHDVADLSHRDRFAKQLALFEEGVAYVWCATQYVGPEGEPLWIDASTDGPSHHGAVMFRRDAYERAGGYRAQFYYGQDYDLWYRLDELGTSRTTQEVLYTGRITPGSISSSARPQQERLARLSEAARELRRLGESDAAILAEAAEVKPVRSATTRRIRASGLYFIGEALRRNGDPRARRYLRAALAAWPLSPRAWLRLVQSLISSRPQ
jgi:glycosyltransferase involved in cell wall biosynthesis